jgi:hypothetical protein
MSYRIEAKLKHGYESQIYTKSEAINESYGGTQYYAKLTNYICKPKLLKANELYASTILLNDNELLLSSKINR